MVGSRSAEESKSRSYLVQVDDIPVYFPYEPYPGQRLYIEAVIRALNGKHNAMLESPTGTGKTLCLLTATLAWLKNQREKAHRKKQSEEQQYTPPIRIIYTSRTHSQLRQVVRELKATCYRPVMSVVGSRDVTCINMDLRDYTGRMKNLKCKEETKKSRCQYFNKNDKGNIINLKNKIAISRTVVDIEELSTWGKDCNTCPFYTMKAVSDVADILFMPYNYLTDKNIRDTYTTKIQGSILVFDEAHNIEKSAEEGASVAISTWDISQAIGELDTVLAKLLTEIRDPSKHSESMFLTHSRCEKQKIAHSSPLPERVTERSAPEVPSA